MIRIDMKDQAVLITGGTKGIGLATALQFGQAGARTYLTYKWGSADEAQIYDAFKVRKAPEPLLIEADVTVDADTDNLLEQIKKREKRIDFFISNVGVARRARSLRDYRKRSLFKTLEYSTWPLIEYTRKIHKVFGFYPKHLTIKSPKENLSIFRIYVNCSF